MVTNLAPGQPWTRPLPSFASSENARRSLAESTGCMLRMRDRVAVGSSVGRIAAFVPGGRAIVRLADVEAPIRLRVIPVKDLPPEAETDRARPLA